MSGAKLFGGAGDAAAERRATFILVSSPLQLLNAGELLDHHDLTAGDADLTVIEPSEPVAQAQLRQVLASRSWPELTLLGPSELNPPWRKHRWLRRVIAQRREQVVRLVLGDYRRNFLRHLAHSLHPDEVILLDDGTATLLVADHRRGLSGAAPGGAWRLSGTDISVGRRFLHRALRLRIGDLPAVTFFTIYDLLAHPDDHVVRHRYEGLRRRYPNTEIVDGAMFIGSNIVEADIVSFEGYSRLVGHATRSVDGPLRYFAHRRETREKLDRLAAFYDLEVIRPQLPLELHLLSADGRIPNHVYGIASSALDTLAVLFDGRLRPRALRPLRAEVAPAARENVARLFEHLLDPDWPVDVVDVR